MSASTDRGVRVAALRISNILGIATAEIRPGQVTLVEGANGEGKTSILEAFRAVLSGGHDATLLRQGSTSGEIVMLLDDGVEITKTVTADKTTVAVTHPEFGRLPKTATFLDKLRDLFALNPVDFLLAKRETRLQLLLAAIPMKINPRDLTGVLPLCSTKPNFEAHAMLALNVIEKDLYDQRTGVNRVAKEKRTTAQEMAKALPPEAVGQEGVVAELKAAREAQRAFIVECHQKAERINIDAERERTRLRNEADAQIEAIRARLERDFKGLQGGQDVSHEMLADERRATDQRLAKAVADAEARAETYTRTETTRQHLHGLLVDADKFELKSQQLTAGLTELDEIRAALLDELPIKGLAVVDGDIQVDGIPFDRLNESKKVRLAIDVAMLRAGALPVLCVDGIERLDAKSLEALERSAAESCIQLVLARVTDGALQVKVLA